MAGVIVGYHGSPGALAALDMGVELAARFKEPLVVVFGSGPPGGPGEEGRAHRKAIEERGEQVTRGALERAHEGGVEVELVIAPERPAEGLHKLAAERGARFIVVGSHGEGLLKGALAGSVPHKLLQIAETAVVVVPG
jgi:nucleotide-binding universal stress UspA family protein